MPAAVKVIVGCCSVAIALTACGATGAPTGTSATATTSAVAFPYPPVRYYTDVAVPLGQPLLGAAEFALGMTVDNFRSIDPRESDTFRNEVKEKLAPDADTGVAPWSTPDFVADTGGLTIRAIGARDVGDGVIEVSVCSYNIPGQYTLYKDGRIAGPTDRNGWLTQPRVQWTDRRALAGPKPAGPRWLWLSNGVDLTRTPEASAEACDSFTPQPSDQRMPDPTTSMPTPTR